MAGSTPSEMTRTRLLRPRTLLTGGHSRARLYAAVLVGAGLVATGLVFGAMRARSLGTRRAEFGRAASRLGASIQTHFQLPLETLLSIPAFYRSSNKVTREEFRSFVGAAAKRHEGVFAFEWVPLVVGDERAAYETAGKNGTGTDFHFQEPLPGGGLGVAAERPQYLPVFYQEPQHDEVLGLDVGADPKQRIAPRKALRVGGLVATDPFELAGNEGGSAVVVYHAIEDAAKDDASQRRGVGLVSVVLRVEDIMREVLADSHLEGLAVSLRDGSAEGAAGALFASGEEPPPDDVAPDVAWTKTVPFADREWTLRVAPESGSEWVASPMPWLVLVMGIGASLFSGFALLALGTILHLRKNVEKAVRLGQYELGDKIGEGGMGQVYEARHAMLRRPTAVKLLPSTDGSHLARFEREVRLTSTLTHPNTIAIYDYGRTPDGIFYYAMELLSGLDVGALVMRHGPLPEQRTIHLLRQVCGSLREAHAHGLIHRDIKPANILVCERGGVHDVVKVLDFGLVKEAADTDAGLTQQGAITGTPHYISPEAINDSRAVDPRSDLYSVGGLGYFMLTGDQPFSGETAMEVLVAHLEDEPVSPSLRVGRDFDPELERVILRCLAKDPAARYASAGDLDDALAACPSAGLWSDKDAADWWIEHPTDDVPAPARERRARS